MQFDKKMKKKKIFFKENSCVATLTLMSSVAGSTSALNRAREPNVSGADQCCALSNGRPRTSKLQKRKKFNN